MAAQPTDAIRAERLRVLSARVEGWQRALRLAAQDLAKEIRVRHD